MEPYLEVILEDAEALGGLVVPVQFFFRIKYRIPRVDTMIDTKNNFYGEDEPSERLCILEVYLKVGLNAHTDSRTQTLGHRHWNTDTRPQTPLSTQHDTDTDTV